MTCHFVYSIPPMLTDTSLSPIIYKIKCKLNELGLPIGLVSNRKPTQIDLDRWPVRSPFENTKHIYNALRSKIPTNLYHLTEKVDCKFKQNDIFLGHPFFPHIDGGYGVTEMALKSVVRPKVFALISPLHCNTDINTYHINKKFLEDIDRMLPDVDILFGIMGKYWWDRWDSSPYAHWKSKMVRLDMAVDVKRYPRVKTQFNSPGKRGYLYIGNSSDPRKGTDFLSVIMSSLSGYCKGWIGSGPDIPGIPRLATHCELTPDFMCKIAADFDFFINPSIADPNPTTILESMAWGFPVICTPQSGYYESENIKNIYLDDVSRSLLILKEMQLADSAILLDMANSARLSVETNYTWDNFTSSIMGHLQI